MKEEKTHAHSDSWLGVDGEQAEEGNLMAWAVGENAH